MQHVICLFLRQFTCQSTAVRVDVRGAALAGYAALVHICLSKCGMLVGTSPQVGGGVRARSARYTSQLRALSVSVPISNRQLDIEIHVYSRSYFAQFAKTDRFPPSVLTSASGKVSVLTRAFWEPFWGSAWYPVLGPVHPR